MCNMLETVSGDSFGLFNPRCLLTIQYGGLSKASKDTGLDSKGDVEVGSEWVYVFGAKRVNSILVSITQKK